eukprot:scaffold54651_cov40-Tisochrysis_lutea.AAC.4
MQKTTISQDLWPRHPHLVGLAHFRECGVRLRFPAYSAWGHTSLRARWKFVSRSSLPSNISRQRGTHVAHSDFMKVDLSAARLPSLLIVA